MLVSLLHKTCLGVQQWPLDGAAARKYRKITQRDEKANEPTSVPALSSLLSMQTLRICIFHGVAFGLLHVAFMC